MSKVTTERLHLRPLSLRDLNAYVALCRLPEVFKYIRGGMLAQHELENHCKRQLEKYQDHWRAHGFGPWAVFLKGTETFIGECGLRYLPDEFKHPNKPDIQEVEFLFTFRPDAWKNDLPVEAGREALRYGFGVKGFEVIVHLEDKQSPHIEPMLKAMHLGYQGDRPLGFHSLGVYAIYFRRWVQGQYRPPEILARAV